MNIVRWNKPRGKHGGRDKGTAIEVSPQEACRLIETLAAQMAERSSNVGRKEFFTHSPREYFTIIVVQP